MWISGLSISLVQDLFKRKSTTYTAHAFLQNSSFPDVSVTRIRFKYILPHSFDTTWQPFLNFVEVMEAGRID